MSQRDAGDAINQTFNADAVKALLGQGADFDFYPTIQDGKNCWLYPLWQLFSPGDDRIGESSDQDSSTLILIFVLGAWGIDQRDFDLRKVDGGG